jgi:hypothetical protein
MTTKVHDTPASHEILAVIPTRPDIDDPFQSRSEQSGLVTAADHHSEQSNSSAALDSERLKDASFEAAHAAPRALQVIGSIVAPTTLLTALFFYFGLLYAIAYYRYFGVNYTALALPFQAVLTLSPSTAILPLALLAGTSLIALWLYRMPVNTASVGARWRVTVLLAVVSLTGLALVCLAAADALFAARSFPVAILEARGLSLTIGILLLGYARRLGHNLPAMRRPDRHRQNVPPSVTVAKWGCLAILLAVGLFWSVGSYAIRMGTGGAQGLAANLRCTPNVIAYSAKRLNLHTAGVREETDGGPDGAYGFRYPGLKLVPQAGDQYLLIPADWTPGTRPAILLQRSESIRLEFVPVVRDECVPG